MTPADTAVSNDTAATGRLLRSSVRALMSCDVLDNQFDDMISDFTLAVYPRQRETSDFITLCAGEALHLCCGHYAARAVHASCLFVYLHIGASNGSKCAAVPPRYVRLVALVANTHV